MGATTTAEGLSLRLDREYAISRSVALGTLVCITIEFKESAKNMTKDFQKSNVALVVYAVVSPERGQSYMVYTEDDIQALGESTQSNAARQLIVMFNKLLRS
jgi:hypothetical protein